MADPIALDTSVAVPMIMRRHVRHDEVVAWRAGRAVCLSGHALAETYSVLTRLPGGQRVDPADAATALGALAAPVDLPRDRWRRLPTVLAEHGIAGGAVYDALVGLAARDNGLRLATRDARALATYAAIGVDVELIPLA